VVARLTAEQDGWGIVLVSIGGTSNAGAQ